MEAILTGQERVLCHMDDVLIFGRTQQEHDAQLHAALQKIQSARVTLKDKCEFSRDCLVFLGALAEKKYFQLDKEGLAIMFGVKCFHQYLVGQWFTSTSPCNICFRSREASLLWPQPGSNCGLSSWEPMITPSSINPDRTTAMPTC